mmetsp:Transcript_20993/g.38878  ORF Transcript_20993/g.38878 Transcript_20993/m.38878 type:complete len:92 (+) Transcript_20993:1387-1662(+)
MQQAAQCATKKETARGLMKEKKTERPLLAKYSSKLSSIFGTLTILTSRSKRKLHRNRGIWVALEAHVATNDENMISRGKAASKSSQNHPFK